MMMLILIEGILFGAFVSMAIMLFVTLNYEFIVFLITRLEANDISHLNKNLMNY